MSLSFRHRSDFQDCEFFPQLCNWHARHERIYFCYSEKVYIDSLCRVPLGLAAVGTRTNLPNFRLIRGDACLLARIIYSELREFI